MARKEAHPVVLSVSQRAELEAVAITRKREARLEHGGHSAVTRTIIRFECERYTTDKLSRKTRTVAFEGPLRTCMRALSKDLDMVSEGRILESPATG
jgi:hypothetical protein